MTPQGARVTQTQKDLPQGWRWTRLEEISRLAGESVQPADCPDEVFAHYSVPAYDSDKGPVFEPGSAILSSKILFPTGAVLFCKLNPRINRVWHVTDTHPHPRLCSSEFTPLVACPGVVDADFLAWALREPSLVDGLRAQARAATKSRERLKPHLVMRAVVPLPPLSEQRRIVAILEEQMAAVGRARAAARAQLQAAKALPAAYLRAVFNSPEAEGWPRKRVGEVGRLLPAGTIATDGDTEVCAITTACLREGCFDPSGVKSARMWAKDAAECEVSPGEVLIARSNTPDLVGRAAMFAGEPRGAVASDLTIRIWPGDSLDHAFAARYLSFLYASGYWKERAGGASGSMKKITRRQIRNEQIPVPDLREQKRVAAVLDDQMTSAGRLRWSVEEELDTINRLPAAILRRAFRGEL